MTDLMSFLTRLRSLRTYKLEPTRMGSVTQEEQQALLKDGANFASWYRHLSQERAGDLSQLFERLTEALPGFHALTLPGAGKQGRTRDLLVEMRANGQYVGLSELQPWLQLLDDALGDAGQLFLISHHPEVIDFLAPENSVLFARPGGGPVRVKSADFDRESGLKASEQIARGLLAAE